MRPVEVFMFLRFLLLALALIGCDDGAGGGDSATNASAGPVRRVEVIAMGETAQVAVTPPFQVLLCDETHCVDYGRVPDLSSAGVIEVGSTQGETRVFWWEE
jgi:hypothetical protein